MVSEFDIEKGVAVKISLPSNLVDGLNIVCAAEGISKSDAAKKAINDYLNSHPLWLSRRYFFPDVSSTSKISTELLKNFRPGLFVKLAGGISHFPASAQFFVGVVHRVKGEKLYVELPMYLNRPTSLLDNSIVHDRISIASEPVMILPRHELIPNLSAWGGTTTAFIYELDLKFIWDFESIGVNSGGRGEMDVAPV